ncbi:MAG: tail fiber protein [Candidatus Hydrogenedentes bacterium]|nr:tail fiber protein [Candidatus Hydrogenedentota bacterium]
MKRSMLMVVVLCVAGMMAGAQEPVTSVPPYINYQGLITDSAGNPVTSTSANLSFRIYTQLEGGTAVWGPQAIDDVPLANGYFNVILGPNDSSNRLILAVFGQPALYLGIKVGDMPEIAPRQRILSVPFAASAGIPVGTILPYAGNTAPAGYLLCDGSDIPAGKEYDSLRALLQVNFAGKTPDLRGRMPIGLDFGAGVVPTAVIPGLKGGAATHTLTVNQLPAHSHKYVDGYAVGRNAEGDVVVDDDEVAQSRERYKLDAFGDNDGVKAEWTKDTTNTGAGNAHNNMPPYLTVNYIIKAY